MARMPFGVVLGVTEDLGERLRRLGEVGFEAVQLVHPRFTEPGGSNLSGPHGREHVARMFAASELKAVSLIVVYPGEDYADIAAVRRTVGLLPRETRRARIEDTKRCAQLARELGAKLLSSHIGYIPEDKGSLDYRGMVEATQEICDALAADGLGFNLETGQEPAAFLREFIGDADRENLGINFDPANIILYGMGDPVAALDIVGRWVRGVHCKDGDWPTEAGKLGEERPLGQGQVGFERFIAKLAEVGYRGPLMIEREVGGEQQMQDFFAAKKLLEGIKVGLGIDE